MLDKDLETLLLIAGAFALGALVVGLFFKQDNGGSNNTSGFAGIANKESWQIIRDSEGFATNIIISRDVHTK